MSTINLKRQGIVPADTYAAEITKVRISSDSAFDPEYPWALDGYNEKTRELSEDVMRFKTHADAVAGIKDFLDSNGFSEDHDYCYECNRVTKWTDTGTCDGCGRIWGHGL